MGEWLNVSKKTKLSAADIYEDYYYHWRSTLPHYTPSPSKSFKNLGECWWVCSSEALSIGITLAIFNWFRMIPVSEWSIYDVDQWIFNVFNSVFE